MLKTILRLLLISGPLLATQACVPPGVATLDPGFIGTAIAQTMAAFTPTSSPEIPVTGEESPTSTLTTVPTATTAAPTETPSLSPTPVMTSTIAATVTTAPSGAVQVSVSVATNCRTGPGREYPRVTGLQVGTLAEVVGRNAAGDYWIIRNPGRPTQTCWLWGQYAALTGDTTVLPVFTPPAPPVTSTPEAGFDVFYEGLESCTGTGWWVDINVENIGGLAFRSISMTLEDRDEDVVLSLRADGFTDRTGCTEVATREALPAGSDRTVSSPVFNYNPNNHRLRATIRLCSNPGQRGTCVTQTVNFEP